MDNETLFYVLGVIAAVSAVVVSLLGFKVRNFPGRTAPLVVLWFVILVGGGSTFVVRYSQEHEEHRAAELEHASKEIEKEESTGPFEEGTEGAETGETAEGGGAEGAAEDQEGGQGGAEGGGEAAGEGSTLQLAAEETEIAYDTTSLTAQAGEVTIEFDNPSSIPHDVAILKDGEEIAKTEIISEAEESVSAELEPGTYTFLCTVPGHAEAGMEGTLTVE